MPKYICGKPIVYKHKNEWICESFKCIGRGETPNEAWKVWMYLVLTDPRNSIVHKPFDWEIPQRSYV